MADGLAAGTANSILSALIGATDYTKSTAVWVQLHVGAPGSAGTANVAGNAVRVNATAAFGTPSSGSVTNSAAALNWTSVSTSETYSHCTLWTASTAGTFIASGSITSSAVTAGDNFSIPTGDLTVSLPTAA